LQICRQFPELNIAGIVMYPERRLLAPYLAAMLSAASFALITSGCSPVPDTIESGIWRATIGLPGGELVLSIELDTDQNSAWFINGGERVAIGDVRIDGRNLSLIMPAFNNRIDAELGRDGLRGTLTLVKLYGEKQVMPFHAVAGDTRRYIDDVADPQNINGRWAVTFIDEDEIETVSVGEFEQDGNHVTGTFLTPIGDYRYLEGSLSGNRLRLSTFDGAHAFLFTGEINGDNIINGNFWSGTQWHETWTANRDDNARLPDANTLTYLNDGYDRFEFTFPDLSGNPVSSGDPQFDGKVVIVALNGSWCPNCHDEAAFMAAFHKQYRDQGLEVVALMFEHFGSFSEAVETTRRMHEKFDIQYTSLIAGISDKDEAGKALPMLNKVLAFPTMIFIDRKGEVRRIQTGFTGPGTGDHYEEFKQDFTAFVEQLLEESA
jgi:thiol-disulfide isomerase/thioredoxin